MALRMKAPPHLEVSLPFASCLLLGSMGSFLQEESSNTGR